MATGLRLTYALDQRMAASLPAVQAADTPARQLDAQLGYLRSLVTLLGKHVDQAAAANVLTELAEDIGKRADQVEQAIRSHIQSLSTGVAA
jgi:hypothetical protein